MPWSRRIRQAAFALLIVGAIVGATVYVTADPDTLGAGNVQIIDGVAYSVSPSDDRQRIYQDERMGGQAAVLMDEFEVWFVERWRGRALGVTLAVLAVCGAALMAWSAQFFELDEDDGAN